MPLAIDEIVEDIQAVHYEISTESRLVRVGLKEEQNLEAILARFPRLTSLATVSELKRAVREARAGEERERLARLYLYCLGHYVHQKLVKLDDEVNTFFSKAAVRVDGELIPYYELYPRLVKEEDFDRRERVGRGFIEVHEKANPMLEEILRKDTEILTRDFGYASYTAYCEDKKELNYGRLASLLEASLHRTAPIYGEIMGAFVSKTLAKPWREIWRVHIPYLLKMKSFDQFFPKEEIFERLNRSLARIGLNLQQYPNIHLDLEERPKKNPRACCFTSRVPDEIHLILKPTGGLKDYESFLHEGGHALHYGSTDGQLPYEYRELSRSYALSEMYAFLLQNLTMNVTWLAKEQEVPEEASRKIRKERILTDLFMYRRYVGKFLAELAFFQKGDLKDSSLYARSLRESTGFIYEPGGYLADLDAEFYSMDYLRAWIAEAQLENHIKKTFGEEWFRDPEAGKFLVSLWRTGEKETPEAVLRRFGYEPFDVSYLEKRFEEART